MLVLILYVTVHNFSVESGTSIKQWIKYLDQGHNAVSRMRLEPVTPWSRVKHPSTEPLLISRINIFNPMLLFFFFTGFIRCSFDVMWLADIDTAFPVAMYHPQKAERFKPLDLLLSIYLIVFVCLCDWVYVSVLL